MDSMTYTGKSIEGKEVTIALRGGHGAYGTEYVLRVQGLLVAQGLNQHEALTKYFELFSQLIEIKKTATVYATR